MSYTPTNWVNGDIITASELNKMEQGIATANNKSSGEDYLAYDVVMKTTIRVDNNGYLSLDNYEIIKGNFVSIKAKIKSGHIISGLMSETYFYEDTETYSYIMVPMLFHFESDSLTSPIYFYSWDTYYQWTMEGLSLD